MRKRMTELRGQTSVFWSLLFANLVPSLCAVLLLALVFVPLMNSAAVENDAAHEDNLLYAVSSYFEEQLSNAENVTNSIEQSPWLHDIFIDHILNQAVLSHETKDTVTTDLAVLAARWEELSCVSFRYYGEEDAVYTGSGVFSNLAYFQEIGPERLQYFFFPLDGTEAGFSTVEHNGQNYLIYRDRLQDVAGGRYKGEVNLFFQTERIGRRLELLTGGEIAAFRILGSEGQTLWEYRFADNTEETVAVSGEASSGMYSLEIDVPLSVHARTTDRVRLLTILAILIDLIICVASAIVLSQMNYRPFQSIVRKFAGDVPKNDNEFVSLNRVMDRILLEKSETETSLDHLRPLARQKLLGGLLDGTAFLGALSIDQLRYCALEFDYPMFNVIAVDAPFSELAEEKQGQAAELAMETLTEHCKRQAAINAYLYYEDSNRYRIILNYAEPAALQEYLALLAEKGSQYFRQAGCAAAPAFGVGRAVRHSSEIYRAAEQAATALNFGMLNHTGSVSDYAEVAAQVDANYFYPFSEEMLLSRAIAESNMESAKAILREVIETNENQPRRSPQAVRLLYADLRSTVLRSCQSLGIAGMVDERADRQLCSFEQVLSSIEALIDEVSRQIDSRRRGPTATIEQKIFAYVDENLYNPTLSLGSIAEYFHRSTAYISTLFKNQKGMNYSDYVNQARIHRAVELLTSERMDTEAVYHAVGYISISTFRRNFIKYTGRNPGDFNNRDTTDAT